MIPKEQTRIGEGGNCFATALASILETPIPEFGDGADYWQRVRAYLARHNLAYKRVPLDRPPSGWATLEGVSPRGGLHATVAYNGKFKHDPHPVSDDPRRGLAEPQYYGELMPLDKYRAGLHRALDAAMDGFSDGQKFHNSGPFGERDYEDNLAQAETRGGYVVSPVQARIDARAAKLANVAKQRFALIDKLTAAFRTSKGRRPLPSELDAIYREANRTLGL